MTAIKPIENRRVVAVAAETYPVNAVCAHPDCTEPSDDPHHAFPRSAIGGDSYFVSITFDTYEEAVAVLGKNPAITEVIGVGFVSTPIPHAVGGCRAHHEQLESRIAKLVLADGVWTWWEGNDGHDGNRGAAATMVEVGELNPQPGAGKGKRKRKKLNTAERRKRKIITVRVPADSEDGSAIWDETQERIKKKLVEMELYDEHDTIPAYEAWVAGANDWLNS